MIFETIVTVNNTSTYSPEIKVSYIPLRSTASGLVKSKTTGSYQIQLFCIRNFSLLGPKITTKIINPRRTGPYLIRETRGRDFVFITMDKQSELPHSAHYPDRVSSTG